MLIDLLGKLPQSDFYNLESCGKSESGLDVYKLKVGNGAQKVMAWSQMHGNEATGTLALLEFTQLILNQHLPEVWEELTFVAIFMVNPDGANVFSRRNAFQIDLNRDARAQIAKETQLLIEQINLEKPDVALNLLDQRNIFGVSGVGNPATISFLAPSFNEQREVNACREKCMMLISALAEGVQEQIGSYVGKYTDEYYPTAFGEYVQSLNIPCILIESGGHKNDNNREVARKMNVFCLFKLFSTLIDNGWKQRTVAQYYKIPENDTNFFDLILKNVKISVADRIENVDLGLLISQTVKEGVLQDVYCLQDIGDLRFKHGLETIDLGHETIVCGGLGLNNKLSMHWPGQDLEFTKGIRK
jgi:hypothetical protein